MGRLPALVTALLLPTAQPLLVSAVASNVVLVSQAPAQAQSAEAVAKVAQAITLRIEGATQGSGVLVKRDGTRYTVLTAWHVVSGQRAGEELDIYTPDGQRHQLEQGSIKRLGEVDLAVLTFTSSGSYKSASIGDLQNISSGSSIYVSGFPLPTSAVPIRLFRFLDGRLITKATIAIPSGFQLLYSNQTLPGMSGGAVLNTQGQLVGIHAGAESADQISESTGKAIATGVNFGVPINYYIQSSFGIPVVGLSTQAPVLSEAQATSSKPSVSEPAATATKPGKPSAPDWRSYGPLQVDWANWQPMGDSYVAPSLNSDGQPLYLAINCNTKRLNATGQWGSWKTWDAPISDFEHKLIRDLCKA